LFDQVFLHSIAIHTGMCQPMRHRPQQRQALLQKIQQKAHDEARFMPIWENAFLYASEPRAAVSELHRDSFAYSAPYEDVRLKSS
jgi:hypothetical protein